MLSDLKISKEKPSEPALNYEYLRTEGLRYIQKLAGKIWTDYNVHDPGVTILELLCYAITDLGYRTSYPVKDILAYPIEDILTGEENGTDKIQEKIQEKLHEQFLSALNILPCKPVTETDYRKLLIDIDGIRNAWLEKADVSYFVNCKESKLVKEKTEEIKHKEIKLNGLYNIKLELEEDIDLNNTALVNSKIKRARDMLQRNRNLCEDFLDIDIVNKQGFRICAEIDIAFDGDADQIEAEIFYNSQNYLTPPVRFHTLKEMFALGKRADEIFEGPILTHGFIDDDQLRDSETVKQIRLSDIIKVIMGIKGVQSVREIIINPADDSSPGDDKWVLDVLPGHQPVLDISLSRIVYYKGSLPCRADKNEAANIIKELEDREKAAQSAGAVEDIPIPAGDFREIEEYYSFQNHFPDNYGINERGLRETDTKTRKAKAKQLKAYLLFFDQLLADYFSQLAHVKNLFSLDEGLKQTYFTQAVKSIKDVDELYIDINDLEKNIQDLTENADLFFDRRNRFLDHLLARFSEDFNEYAWIMYSLFGNQINEEIILDKIKYLKEYQAISSGRARAFNYKDINNSWGKFNISGLEYKIARLLGIKSCNEVYLQESSDDVDRYRFRVFDSASNKTLLSSTGFYLDKDLAKKRMDNAIKFAMDEKNYTINTTSDGKFRFSVVNPQGTVVALRKESFDTMAECESAIQELIVFLFRKYGEEGFFIVEHILLRPKQEANNHFLPVCVDPSCSKCSCTGSPVCDPDCTDCLEADPYSFRISVILPGWSKRFEEKDFRNFFHKTFNLVAPAHILPRICWVDEENLNNFAAIYKKWLDAHYRGFDESTLPLYEELINQFNGLRSIYPKATLSECIEGTMTTPPFILDKTNIGTNE